MSTQQKGPDLQGPAQSFLSLDSTQFRHRDRVLHGLLFGRLCGQTFLEDLIPRYSAVIHSLRREGWRIERRRCVNPLHTHSAPRYEWQVTPVGESEILSAPR